MTRLRNGCLSVCCGPPEVRLCFFFSFLFFLGLESYKKDDVKAMLLLCVKLVVVKVIKGMM